MTRKPNKPGKTPAAGSAGGGDDDDALRAELRAILGNAAGANAGTDGGDDGADGDKRSAKQEWRRRLKQQKKERLRSKKEKDAKRAEKATARAQPAKPQPGAKAPTVSEGQRKGKAPGKGKRGEDDKGGKGGKGGAAPAKEAPQEGQEQGTAQVNATDVKPVRDDSVHGPWMLVADRLCEPNEVFSAPSHVVSALRTRARAIWDNTIAARRETKQDASSHRWLQTAMTRGTLADKVAAMTIAVRDSPVFAISSLESMVAMAGKKARRESMMVFQALRELFTDHLLPKDGRLKFFHEQPLTDPGVTNAHLLRWIVEDALKYQYIAFLHALERGCHDNVQTHKTACVRLVSDLLRQTREQEKALLTLLVDKLADPDKKMCSNVVFLLGKLLEQHPAMKHAVAATVHDLIFRPTSSPRCCYFATIFLNQIPLSAAEASLANSLMETYLALFKKAALMQEQQAAAAAAAAKTKGGAKAKARAMAKAKAVVAAKGRPGAPPPKAATKQEESADEAQWDRLMSALLTGVNRALAFSEEDTKIVKEHVETLFRAVHTCSFATSLQALMLLCQVMLKRQSVSDRFYRSLYSKLQSPALLGITAQSKGAVNRRQALLLNLMWRAMKADPSVPRALALTKRLLQIAAVQRPTFTCAALFLVSELAHVRPDFKTALTATPLPAGDNPPGPQHDSPREDSDEESEEGRKEAAEQRHYDGFKRDPLFAGAQYTCVWELTFLAQHAHPSVRLFATSLSLGKRIEYAGDPLEDFSLTNFLHRFVFKNPKRKGAPRAGAMQPKRPLPSALSEAHPARVDDAEFLARFYAHRRKSQRDHPAEKRKRKEKKQDAFGGEDDDDDEDDDEGEGDEGEDQGDSDGGMDFAGMHDNEDEEDEEEDGMGGDGQAADSDSEIEFPSEGSDVGEPGDDQLERMLLEDMSDQDDDEDDNGGGHNSSSNNKRGEKGGDQSGGSSWFAPAEEFSQIIEEAASGKPSKLEEYYEGKTKRKRGNRGGVGRPKKRRR